MPRSAYCWLLPLVTVACGNAAEIPSIPDLSSLVQGYQEPSAELDDTMVAAALNELPPLDELAVGFEASEAPVGEVGEASAPAANSSGSGVNLQGSIKVTVRCPGELLDPVLDPAINGTFSFTLAIAESRIRHAAGGRASNCVLGGNLRGLPTRVVLDGDVAVDFGRDLGFGQGLGETLLISVDGKIEIAGHTFDNISARISDGHIEHLFKQGDKTFVASLSPRGVTIRDHQGVWLCADLGTCARE